MKINYFFPIFNDDNAKQVLENFVKSKFFEENLQSKFIFVCKQDDSINFNFLTSFKYPKEILLAKEDFSYNDAFYMALPYFEDAKILLADCKVAKLDVVFKACLEKNLKGAKVIHIMKRQSKVKAFFTKILQKFYNFLIKIFTGKKDRCNIISLGLIDEDVVNVLKVLPKKSCFLKNTKQLCGWETRTIYIPENTTTYKPKLKKLTNALKLSYSFFALSIVLIAIQIIINIFAKKELFAFNVVFILLEFVFIVGALLLSQKHIFDVRNSEDKNKDLVCERFIEKTESVKKEKEKKENIKIKEKSKQKTKNTVKTKIQ